MSQEIKLPEPPAQVCMGYQWGDLPVYGHEHEALLEYGRQCAEAARREALEEAAGICKELEERLLARKPALKAWKVGAAVAIQLWCDIRARGEA